MPRNQKSQFVHGAALPIFACFHEFHTFMELRGVHVGILIVLRSLWDMFFHFLVGA